MIFPQKILIPASAAVALGVVLFDSGQTQSSNSLFFKTLQTITKKVGLNQLQVQFNFDGHQNSYKQNMQQQTQDMASELKFRIQSQGINMGVYFR